MLISHNMDYEIIRRSKLKKKEKSLFKEKLLTSFFPSGI